MSPSILTTPVQRALLAALLLGSGAWAQTSTVEGPPSAVCAPDSGAPALLNDLIRAHERGQIEAFQRLLDVRLPGYQALQDAAVRERQTQVSTRIDVLNLQVQCAPQAASIHFAWEKRSSLVNDLRPVLASGSTSMLLARRMDEGMARWRVVSISEPNPFWQRATAPAKTPAEPTEPDLPVMPVEPEVPAGRVPSPNS